MKRLLTLLLLTLTTTVALAQTNTHYTIKGTAIDSTIHKAAPFATVLLIKADSTVQSSTYSDENGKFELTAPKGNYTLKINYVGYAPFSLNINLTANTDLKELLIKQDIEIEAVQVLGQLITSDIDKVSYNTDADPEAASLTALEMLRKVPMLSVDGNDNIRLRGEGNFKILVNGKSSSLMNSNYKEVLRSMPANSIKRIEVITNPPAKYDAEGVGGIINIITTKRAPEGISGSLNAGYDTFNSWRAGGYLALSKNKFNLSASLNTSNFNRPANLGEATIYNYTSDKTYEQLLEIESTSKGNFYGMNIEASYEFDSLNLLTFSLNGNLGSHTSNSISDYNMFSKAGTPTAIYSQNNTNTGDWGGVGASIDYQHSFANRPDRLLTASYIVDYSPNNSSSTSSLSTTGIGEFADPDTFISPYEHRSDNDAWGMEHAFQIDYFDKITKHHQIETGLKYTLRPSVSNSINEILINEVWEDNPALKNDLDYMQHIGSLYAAYQYSLNSFSVKAGARAEYTLNDGTFISQVNTPMFSQYFNLIPYLSLGYKINDFQSLKLGYTQRISRPGISQLNPYIDDEGALIQTGNPNLKPELSNTFDLSYNIFKAMFNINASLTAQFSNNAIQDISTIVGTKIIMKPENIGKNQSYTASIGGGLRLWQGKLSLYANISGGYAKDEANNGTGLENEGWQYNTFMQATANPWKEGTISLYAGNGYSTTGLQSNNMSYYFNGLSVSQNFLQKRLQVNLSISSPLEKYVTYTYGMSDPNMAANYISKSQQRNISIGITWRFGKQTSGVKRTSRTIENTDTVSTSENPTSAGK